MKVNYNFRINYGSTSLCVNCPRHYTSAIRYVAGANELLLGSIVIKKKHIKRNYSDLFIQTKVLFLRNFKYKKYKNLFRIERCHKACYYIDSSCDSMVVINNAMHYRLRMWTYWKLLITVNDFSLFYLALSVALCKTLLCKWFKTTIFVMRESFQHSLWFANDLVNLRNKKWMLPF